MADDDKKTIKFQMMMSPAEAEALDEWGFRHRIRSRAESIRRLCQIGLLFEAEYPKVLRRALDLTSAMTSNTKELDSAFETSKSKSELYEPFLKSRAKNADLLAGLLFEIATKVALIMPIAGGKSIDRDLDLYKEMKELVLKLDSTKTADHRVVIDLLNALSGKGKPEAAAAQDLPGTADEAANGADDDSANKPE